MPSTISIGRAPSNHIVIQCPTVSLTHALITFIEDGTIVYSDKSTNGSIINGKALRGSAVYIKAGDQIVLPGKILIDWSTLNRYNPYSHSEPAVIRPGLHESPEPKPDPQPGDHDNEIPEPKQHNTCGKLSLIFSLVAIVLYIPPISFLGVLFSSAALVLGFIGLFFKPKGKAIAGLILSIIVPVIWCLGIMMILGGIDSVIDDIYYY